MSVADVRGRYNGDAASYAHLWAPVLHHAMQPLLDSIDWDDVNVALEIGCGTGGVLRDVVSRARNARIVVGADLSEGMLRQNSHRPVVQADAHAIPARDGRIDLVVCGFMLQHAPDPARVVRGVARALRPGGVFALGAWAGESEWGVEKAITEELDRVGAPAMPSSRPGAAATDSAEKLRGLMASAALEVEALDIRPLQWTPTLDELVEQMTTMRSTGRRFALLEPSVAQCTRARIEQRLADMRDSFTPPHDLCLLRARKRGT
jgi:SAM-dependent methyltransferase